MRLFRAKLVWLSGIALALAGALPVLCLLVLLGWQFATHLQAGSWVPLPASLLFTDHSFAFLPAFPWPWLAHPEVGLSVHQPVAWVLGRLHIGMVFAIPGLVVMALGALIAIRQAAVVRTEKRLRDDRLRRIRVRQYSEHGDRVEPFIGPGSIADPLAQKKEAA